MQNRLVGALQAHSHQDLLQIDIVIMSMEASLDTHVYDTEMA